MPNYFEIKKLIKIPRARTRVEEQVVRGLVSGGLLGPALQIERRDAQSIEFFQLSPMRPSVPSRGLIRFASTAVGTELEFVLCFPPRFFSALWLVFAVGVSLGLKMLVPESPISWVVAGFCVATWLWGRARAKRTCLARLHAYLHNSEYLRT